MFGSFFHQNTAAAKGGINPLPTGSPKTQAENPGGRRFSPPLTSVTSAITARARNGAESGRFRWRNHECF